MKTPRDDASDSIFPANDNAPVNSLRVELKLPRQLPIQLVEVEVFAELLDALPLPANDNDEGMP
jgi:hypothetical protein